MTDNKPKTAEEWKSKWEETRHRNQSLDHAKTAAEEELYNANENNITLLGENQRLREQRDELAQTCKFIVCANEVAAVMSAEYAGVDLDWKRCGKCAGCKAQSYLAESSDE